MSYQGISIKEIVDRINGNSQGLFLPEIQRPFVWGSRYESELYICKLFDSLMRGFPIGTLILWNTSEKIPYREFTSEYNDDIYIDNSQKIVDKGLWGREDKWLVYDGQQRLQTLYSCLKYTFNNKVLVYNLLFDNNNQDIDPDETGFSFIDKDKNTESHVVRLNEIFTKLPNTREKNAFRRQILEKCGKLEIDKEELIEDNLDSLWEIFVKTDSNSLAFFPISYKDKNVVDEIFQRLNTGGIQLSLADLLFSKIKRFQYDFEQNLQYSSKKIYDNTGRGYKFDAYDTLQLIHLILKGGVRVDPRKVTKEELAQCSSISQKLEKPLHDFFTDFLYGEFKINNSSIIPKRLAILPIIIYFYNLYNKGITYKKFEQDNIKRLKKFLILSQINEWNLQVMVDNFTFILNESIEDSLDFPLSKLINWIKEKDKRPTDLTEIRMNYNLWFSLKILTPQREYMFDPDIGGRFSPEIDHIYPMKLDSQSVDYQKWVNTVWNMQPVKGDINNYKRNKHPIEFFSSKEGMKYLKYYDHLPNKNLKSPVWEDPVLFINRRKVKMIRYLKSQYGLTIISSSTY